MTLCDIINVNTSVCHSVTRHIVAPSDLLLCKKKLLDLADFFISTIVGERVENIGSRSAVYIRGLTVTGYYYTLLSTTYVG